jgi:predicted TPR repeat methyltransferase
MPDSAEAHYNLGSALLRCRRAADAIASVQEAIRLQPGFLPARSLHAVARAATGDIDGSVELLRESAHFTVPIAETLQLLADELLQLRLIDRARACYERVLQHEPDNVMARHFLTALSGANPDHPIDGYVRQLFEANAATFDKVLTTDLGYRIPQAMVEALRAIRGAHSEPWDVLDLGCGTGLVGVEIAPHSRRLVGIDIAQRMLEQARERKLYAELRCADLTAALADQERGGYDVITAADVFVYVGRLDEVIPAIRRILRTGGSLAFSVEAAEALPPEVGPDGAAGYRLRNTGRYAHSADYLRKLALENHFDVEVLSSIRIRLEHHQPVEGWLTVWNSKAPLES